jgi:hypothetical protein
MEVFLKPEKIGTRRKITLANVNASTFIEETPMQRSYVKRTYDPCKDIIDPQPGAPHILKESDRFYKDVPGATPLIFKESDRFYKDESGAPVVSTPILKESDRFYKDEDTQVDTHKETRVIPALIILLILIIIFTNWRGNTAVPVMVVSGKWFFSGWIEEYRTVRESSTAPPAGAAIVNVNVGATILHYNEVLQRIETVCTESVETYDTLSHYETVCKNELLGYEEIEEYSHSEKECLSNGICEEKDIYDRKNIPKYTTICREEPVYKKKDRIVENCVNHEVRESQPVFGNVYTYDVNRWVLGRFVNMDSSTHSKEDVASSVSAARYRSENWSYELTLSDGTKHNVDENIYNQWMLHPKKHINVESYFFGLWNSVHY